MKILAHRIPDIISTGIFFDRTYIQSAISTRDLTKELTRCRSSNLWAYGMNVRKAGDNTGDVIIQFKGKNGGPDGLYIYYDVPVRIYRQLLSAPSKGHFFWTNIRNKYSYDKLGDKSWRGKLPNAIR